MNLIFINNTNAQCTISTAGRLFEYPAGQEIFWEERTQVCSCEVDNGRCMYAQWRDMERLLQPKRTNICLKNTN